MSDINRYGTSKDGAGGQNLPFARAVEADGWLYVSGQVAMENGEIIDGGIVTALSEGRDPHATVEVLLRQLISLPTHKAPMSQAPPTTDSD